MNPYDHKKIEKKWQDAWEAQGTYKTQENSDKPKQIVMDMFPYPSGVGLHVGHPRGFIATDVYSRMKRMQGFNVLHPMGWDAFGLPAENFAIANKIHPRIAVEQNIQSFKDQLSVIGFDYDWSREIKTTDPAFYKWTQWAFIKMYEKGLAYESWEPINWCPGCQTGLANEDIEADGTCERCGSKVEKKPMRQWVLKITEYADRMLADLEKLPKWPEGVKDAQRNWIGKSEGAEIDFKLINSDEAIKVFTTRADTLFGVTYVVLAPEHPLVQTLDTNIKNYEEVVNYISSVKEKSDIDRTNAKKEKTGVVLEGIFAINPATNEQVPVWVADYVLANHGTGAVMAVPAHDERDFEFATKYNLPNKQVIEPVVKQTIGSAAFHENEEVQENRGIIAVIKHWSEDKYLGLYWPEPEWGTWLTGGIDEGFTPEETVYKEILEETGYKNAKIVASLGTIHSRYYHAPKKINRFGHTPAFLVKLENNEQVTIEDHENSRHQAKWLTLEEMKKFLTGASHLKILELLDNPTYTGEGLLINSGKFDGMESEEAQKAITEFVGGKMVSKYKLKDWVFSRQRYWGEPIPMIHCEKCGVVPVPEKDLPVTLPEVESYAPTGTGESPLANITEWVNVPCPKCDGAAKRETNTMPQWAGSSWYYLRYIDPKNNSALIDSQKEKDWMPVDVYAGADHATRHLIYARFWHKFLFDIGTVSTEEPFPRLEFLGYILAENGKKFGKREGNGIDPVDVVNQFGADAFRLYEMFIGPFEQTALWNSNGMVGTLRFVEKVWRIAEKITDSASDTEVQKILNKTIKKVTEDIEGFKFNTAVSAFMILTNAMESATNVSKNDFKKLLQILAPFAPHVTEELWAELAGEESVHLSHWPAFDAQLLAEETVVLGVQVNGKVRAEVEIAHDATEGQVREMVMQIPEIIKWIDGKEVKKFIFIPKKIISIVV